MSPMWRKLDLCSDIFTGLYAGLGFPSRREQPTCLQEIHTSQRLRFSRRPTVAPPNLHFSEAAAEKRKKWPHFACLFLIKAPCASDLVNFFLYVRRRRELLFSITGGGGDCCCQACQRIPLSDMFLFLFRPDTHFTHITPGT